MESHDKGTPSSGAQSAELPPNTIAGAVKSLEHHQSEMCLLAEEAERIANMVCGPEPGTNETSASAKDHAPECMVDHLHRRIGALRSPSRRINEALARINRRVG